MPAGAGDRHFQVPPTLTHVCPSLQKNVRMFLPSFLCSQTTLALANNSAAASPCNFAGGATAPADEIKENEIKENTTNKPAAMMAACLSHAGISVAPTLNLTETLLRHLYQKAGLIPAIVFCC
jgi:hypothetical protein